MPIIGMTDLKTLNDRYRKPVISVLKGSPKNGNAVGSNLKERLRIHIATPWLRDRTGLLFDKNGDYYCDEIKIYLAESTPDRTFPTFYQKWSASTLEVQCDGENIIQQSQLVQGPKGKYPQMVPANLPCKKQGSPECPLGCKASGQLYFYLRDLEVPHELASLNTVHKREIFQIASLLQTYYEQLGSLTLVPGAEAYGRIPFVLKRLIAKTKKPNFTRDGERTGTLKTDDDWPVTITIDPVWYQQMSGWKRLQEVQKYGFQLPEHEMRQLGFAANTHLLRSAEIENIPLLAAGDRALSPTLSEEETIKIRLIRELGAKLKELNKSQIWAREMAYKLFRVTSPEGENLSTKLSIAQLREYLEFLHSEKVEQYVETYAHNYQEFQNVEVVEAEIAESEEVEPEPDNF